MKRTDDALEEEMTEMIAKRTLILAVLVSLLACQASLAQETSKPRGPRPRAIKIYFYHEPGEYIDLSPVTRMVRSAAPARAAINALLAGPTPREERKGFSGLATDQFRIATLTIRDGTARINFVSKRDWAGFPGDTAPIRFKKAVELTLMQFSNVKRVIVSLDGDLNFAAGR